MAAPPRLVQLKVFNDLVCPNCFIGHQELLTAISYCLQTLQLNITFDIEILPYRLIPLQCLPENCPNISRLDFLIKTLGDRFFGLQGGIGKWAEENNIPISFNGIISQSTQGHRLLRKSYLMGGQKLQLPLLGAIFTANLEEGKDISDFDVLSDVAAKVGVMTKEEALEFLKSGELVDEVNNMIAQASKKGITGVPFTVIDGRWGVAGGQSPDVFVQIFKKLADTEGHIAPSPMVPPPSMGSSNLAFAQQSEDLLPFQIC